MRKPAQRKLELVSDNKERVTLFELIVIERVGNGYILRVQKGNSVENFSVHPDKESLFGTANQVLR